MKRVDHPLDVHVPCFADLVVRTLHLGAGKEQIFPIHQLTDQPLNQLTFKDKNGELQRVEEYMRRYNRQVSAKLPAAVQLDRAHRRQSYFPLEFLEIVPGQRVNMEKQQIFPNMVCVFGLH